MFSEEFQVEFLKRYHEVFDRLDFVVESMSGTSPTSAPRKASPESSATAKASSPGNANRKWPRTRCVNDGEPEPSFEGPDLDFLFSANRSSIRELLRDCSAH
ncbi:MAG TPA: hypothetical protein VIM58_03825 [Candidatus Methylacidiphilales bacterium]